VNVVSDGHSDAPPAPEQIRAAMGLHAVGLPSLDDIPSATHWPSVPPGKAEKEWDDLQEWVEDLQRRFPHLDHHVIPPCWWLHNEHVEALSALRDHERVSYLSSAPATAPVEWMRALRDITALLRSWTAECACGAAHQDQPVRLRQNRKDGWEQHVASDVRRRRQRAARAKPGGRPT
jgi:hypothetical protein